MLEYHAYYKLLMMIYDISNRKISLLDAILCALFFFFAENYMIHQGVLALKALKLSDYFMELYCSNNFTGEK